MTRPRCRMSARSRRLNFICTKRKTRASSARMPSRTKFKSIPRTWRGRSNSSRKIRQKFWALRRTSRLMGRRSAMTKTFRSATTASRFVSRRAISSLRVAGILRGFALRQFALNLVQPFQLGLKLFDYQRHHPDGFVMRMADFRKNRIERFFFARDFSFKKFRAAPELLFENAGARLPRKSNPRQEWRSVALCRPVFAFQRVAERVAPFRRRFKDASIRSGCGIFGIAGANQSGFRQFFERVVNLRARNR